MGIGGGTFLSGHLTSADALSDIGFFGAAIAGLAVIYTVCAYLPAARKANRR